MSVIDLDDECRRSESPRNMNARPWFRNRLTLLLGVVAAHASAIALIVGTPGERIRTIETDSLITVFVRPRILVTPAATTMLRPIRVPREAPSLYDVHVPEVERPTIAIAGVGTTAPRPEGELVDPTRFARQAGLQPGYGATVVLRVEVLGSGALGRIEIDVSGGQGTIDEAAIAYARAIQWIGGTIDGRPETIWVRWGVTLVAPA